MRYTVFSVDMWGHVPADCCEAYDCPCIKHDKCTDKCTPYHDDDRCDCHEDMNDLRRCGAIDVPETQESDSEIIGLLGDAGFLSPKGVEVAQVEDQSDGCSLRIVDDAGRCLFYLESEES